MGSVVAGSGDRRPEAAACTGPSRPRPYAGSRIGLEAGTRLRAAAGGLSGPCRAAPARDLGEGPQHRPIYARPTGDGAQAQLGAAFRVSGASFSV
jgi:hypothetical protein